MRGRSLIKPLVALSLLLAPRVASACYDGFEAHGERVHFAGTRGQEGADPDYAQARLLMAWAARAGELVPEDVAWSFGPWDVQRCENPNQPDHEVCNVHDMGSWDDAGFAEPPELQKLLGEAFERVATAEKVTADAKRNAVQKPVGIHAVQVGAFSKKELAEQYAEQINQKQQFGELAWESHSDYSAGGYPAIHDAALVAPTTVNGRTMYRVVVGLFVDMTDAKKYQQDLAAAGHVTAITTDTVR